MTKDSSDQPMQLNIDDDLNMETFDMSPGYPQLENKRSLSTSSLNKPDPNMERSLKRQKAKREIITIEKLSRKPGKIFNKDLVKFDESKSIYAFNSISNLSIDCKLEMNSTLEKDKDYSVVDAKTWQLFKKWYGCDIEIPY